MSYVVGGDGYVSHEDCEPDDATSVTVALAVEDDELCWICAEPIDDLNPPSTTTAAV